MTTLGTLLLLIALVACGAAAVLSLVPAFYKAQKSITYILRVAYITLIALTAACLLLIYCFLTDYYEVYYVLTHHSETVGAWGVFYDISGLWSGSSGSLLTWTWFISMLGSLLLFRRRKSAAQLDLTAYGILSLIMLVFLLVQVISPEYASFAKTPDTFRNVAGNIVNLNGLRMNVLLENWAMAVHPPTLLAGYAGLSIPFVYALASLILNDASKTWTISSSRASIFSFVLLTIGIGLGCVWAYTVLGWGGYWGWDPVENASLIPWLFTLAYAHSVITSAKQGVSRPWNIILAMLVFLSTIFATLVARSGAVDSVHAFSGDSISTVFFGTLMGVVVLVTLLALFIRRNDWIHSTNDMGDQDVLSLTLEVLFLFLGLVMGYLNCSSALPQWLPMGGNVVDTWSYNAAARPLGVALSLAVAICPLMMKNSIWKRHPFYVAIPTVLSFTALLILFFTYLYPVYRTALDANSFALLDFQRYGSSLYYNGLALTAFLVSALIIGTASASVLDLIQRAHVARVKPRWSTLGGQLVHLSIGILLIGLVGSSMYTSNVTYGMPEEPGQTVSLKGYTFKLEELESHPTKGNDIEDAPRFSIYDNNGEYLTTKTPDIHFYSNTQQSKLSPAIMHTPLEDVFIVYNGMLATKQLSVEVHINPLVIFIWVGFALMSCGGLIASAPRSQQKTRAGI